MARKPFSKSFEKGINVFLVIAFIDCEAGYPKKVERAPFMFAFGLAFRNWTSVCLFICGVLNMFVV